MKRKLVLTSAVVLILALLAAGTFAYFTKNARATNVITTGTISIQLNDEIKETGAEKTDTGWTLSGVMPGQAVEKAVSVTNTGTSPAWLRVKLDIAVEMAAGKTDTWQGQNVLQFAVNPDWFLAEDGYYYYSKPVAEKAGTAELFAKDSSGQSTLMLNPQLPNDYQGCAVTINVLAQAVQVKNNNIYVDASGAEVTDANGPLTFDTLSATDENETHESSLDSVFGWPAN